MPVNASGETILDHPFIPKIGFTIFLERRRPQLTDLFAVPEPLQSLPFIH